MKRMVLWGLVGMLLLVVPAWAGDFTDNRNGTVTDSDTGLVWQQATGYGGDWQGALAYCEGLNLANHTDWRLPNIKELESITDDSRYNPAIDTAFFPDTLQRSNYWSSTTIANYTNGAWYVGFNFGGVDDDGYGAKGNSMYARCVRGGQ